MDKSPLAKLAPELRNRIYELLLTHSTTSNIIRIDQNDGKYELTKLSTGATNVALTQTCRLIRQESVQMFYANTIFTLQQLQQNALCDALGAVVGLLDSLGAANAALIRHVQIKGHSAAALAPWSRDLSERISTGLSIAMMGADKICTMAPDCTVRVEFAFAAEPGSRHWFTAEYSDLPKVVLRLGRRSDQVEAALRKPLKPFVEYISCYGAPWACGWMQGMIDTELKVRQECAKNGITDESKYWAMLKEEGSKVKVEYPRY